MMSPARPPAARIERAITVAHMSILSPCSRRPSPCPVVPDDVDPTTCLPWHGEHAERIVFAKVLLGRGNFARSASDSRSPGATRRVELAPIVRHMVVRVRERLLEALQLQRG
jgi:hypothetical protein